MPVKYIVVHEGHVVIERWAGSISHEELVFHERAQLQDPSIVPGAIVLADCRAVTFETTADKVIEMSDSHKQRDNKTYMTKCAVLVKDDDSFAKARIFAEQTTALGLNTIVFGSFDVACTWLGLNVEEIEGLIESIEVSACPEPSQ